MSQRTDIEDGVRAWLVAAGVTGGIPSADSAVLLADEDGPRPPLPYIVVKCILYDVQVGEDVYHEDDADPPLWQARGERSGTVSVNGYGDGAEDWLERAVFMLRAPSIQATVDAAGLTIDALGPIRNLSGLRDSGTEIRVQRDVAIAYRRVAGVGDTEVLTELETVEHTDTYESDHPADRVVINTVTL